jgi:hypothetical protein
MGNGYQKYLKSVEGVFYVLDIGLVIVGGVCYAILRVIIRYMRKTASEKHKQMVALQVAPPTTSASDKFTAITAHMSAVVSDRLERIRFGHARSTKVVALLSGVVALQVVQFFFLQVSKTNDDPYPYKQQAITDFCLSLSALGPKLPVLRLLRQLYNESQYSRELLWAVLVSIPADACG